MKAYIIMAAGCFAAANALAQVAADPTPPSKLEDASGSSVGEPTTDNRTAPQGRDTAPPRQVKPAPAMSTAPKGAEVSKGAEVTPPVDPAVHAPSPETFVQKIALGNLFEIESGNLAAVKARQDDVKLFARNMVRDHTAASQKLKDAANGKPIPGALSAEHKEMMDKLRSLESREFDREYAMQQSKVHQDTVSILRSYSENGNDKALKDFAAEMLPKVEHHLEQARRMDGGPVNEAAR